MNEIITYLLQSSAILTAMYSVYWLFLRKDTFFHVNRFYLMTSLMFSMIIPLFNIHLPENSRASLLIVMLDPVLITPQKVENITSGHLSWLQIAGVIYLTGASIFTLRLVVQLIQLLLVVKRNHITRQDGANLVFVDKGYSPFSFFNLIFIRKEYYIDGKLTPVIAHEKIHIRQYHTIDLLLIEVAVILQWFNPFVWFMGRSVKSLHEFLADEGVLKKGFQVNDYQSLILNEAMGLQLNNLTNNFNVSLLKKRITMMTKTRSASWTLLKVGFAMPALLLVLFLFPAGSNNIAAQDTQQKSTVDKKAVSNEMTSQEDPVYEMVKEMPSYPGGSNALIQYLVTNINYPQEARTKGIQGKVFVQYIVEKDGSVKQVKVLEGFNPECDAEAVRVVKAMPKWIPGKNDNGEPVRVQFVLPIKFSLDEKKSEKKAE